MTGSVAVASTWLHQIDPIALRLPEFELFGRAFAPSVHWYGVMYAIGFGLAWFLGRRRIAQGRLPGVDANAFADLLFYGFPAFLDDPLMLLRIWEGGMSFHGGLLGVLVAMWWWSRRQRLHFFDTVDFVAPLVPAGLGLGRLGNWIGGELWGKATGGDWGVVFPRALPEQFARLDPAALRVQFEAGALDAYARHPSQLYQVALEGVAMFAILWWYSSRPRPRYAVSGMFALLYGVFRFAVEFVREPDAHLGYLAFGWLTMGQVLSLPLVAIGLGLLWASRRAPTPRPAPVAAE